MTIFRLEKTQLRDKAKRRMKLWNCSRFVCRPGFQKISRYATHIQYFVQYVHFHLAWRIRKFYGIRITKLRANKPIELHRNKFSKRGWSRTLIGCCLISSFPLSGQVEIDLFSSPAIQRHRPSVSLAPTQASGRPCWRSREMSWSWTALEVTAAREPPTSRHHASASRQPSRSSG